jgi:transcriptional regulator with XRE-family HTH domain
MHVETGIPGLRERRLAAGISQERLARLADCSTHTVRMVECGYRPSAAMTARIEAALRAARRGEP